MWAAWSGRSASAEGLGGTAASSGVPVSRAAEAELVSQGWQELRPRCAEREVVVVAPVAVGEYEKDQSLLGEAAPGPLEIGG